MIGGVEWELVKASGQFVARLADPPRDLVVSWDDGDKSLYLNVRVPPPPNVPQGERMYVSPLSLLAALTMLPAEFHPTLVATVNRGRADLESDVLGHVQKVVDGLPQRWPEPAKAVEQMKLAAEHVPSVERLALDMAAADAYREAQVSAS